MEDEPTSLYLLDFGTSPFVLKFIDVEIFFLPKWFEGIDVWTDERDENGYQKFQLRSDGDPSEYYVLARRIEHMGG